MPPALLLPAEPGPAGQPGSAPGAPPPPPLPLPPAPSVSLSLALSAIPGHGGGSRCSWLWLCPPRRRLASPRPTFLARLPDSAGGGGGGSKREGRRRGRRRRRTAWAGQRREAGAGSVGPAPPLLLDAKKGAASSPSQLHSDAGCGQQLLQLSLGARTAATPPLPSGWEGAHVRAERNAGGSRVSRPADCRGTGMGGNIRWAGRRRLQRKPLATISGLWHHALGLLRGLCTVSRG